MKDTQNDLIRYRKFLETIPLSKFREEFKEVKWVEQDLPNEILPLASIYKHYWETKDFLDFDSWFEDFWNEIHSDNEKLKVLKHFKKYYFNIDDDGWFKKGFKARMYRTWISMLTQLDFTYALADKIKEGNKDFKIECNEELDRKGVDVKIGNIGFQIAKISQRKEARGRVKIKKKGRLEIIIIPYPVYDIADIKNKIKNPRVHQKTKEKYKKILQSFFKYCRVLKNGFVVFNDNYITPIFNNLNNISALKEEISRISLELAGEF
jgi:hypothetical protein